MDRLLVIRDSLLNDQKVKPSRQCTSVYETEKEEQKMRCCNNRTDQLAKISNNQILIGALLIGLLLVAAIGSLVYINFEMLVRLGQDRVIACGNASSH